MPKLQHTCEYQKAHHKGRAKNSVNVMNEDLEGQAWLEPAHTYNPRLMKEVRLDQ